MPNMENTDIWTSLTTNMLNTFFSLLLGVYQGYCHLLPNSFLQRPVDIINRKKPLAVWFPYTAIEHLWCKLEEFISSGRMVDHCDKLKRLLHEALLKHLQLVCSIPSFSMDNFRFSMWFTLSPFSLYFFFFFLVPFQLRVDSDDVPSAAH